jgi:hypothetical protein
MFSLNYLSQEHQYYLNSIDTNEYVMK